jgi:alpha-N-arabinofuranosidase
MLPVQWKDGWPRITGPGKNVPWVAPRPVLPAGAKARIPMQGTFTVRDDFTRANLPPYWMMLRNPKGDWWRISGGALEIQPKPNAFAEHGNPSLLARRQQHLNAVATTKISFDPQSDDAEAGLIAMQSDEYWYFLAVGREHGKRVIRVRRRAGGQEAADGVVLASALAPSTPVRLRIEAHGPSYDFSWSADGRRWRKLLKGADGTILSTKKAGGFVGAVFGLYARDGSRH